MWVSWALRPNRVLRFFVGNFPGIFGNFHFQGRNILISGQFFRAFGENRCFFRAFFARSAFVVRFCAFLCVFGNSLKKREKPRRDRGGSRGFFWPVGGKLSNFGAGFAGVSERKAEIPEFHKVRVVARADF